MDTWQDIRDIEVVSGQLAECWKQIPRMLVESRKRMKGAWTICQTATSTAMRLILCSTQRGTWFLSSSKTAHTEPLPSSCARKVQHTGRKRDWVILMLLHMDTTRKPVSGRTVITRATSPMRSTVPTPRFLRKRRSSGNGRILKLRLKKKASNRPKSVPAVRFNTKDRKAIEKIYQEVIKDIDTGTYTPNKKEAEFVASQPADAQTQYDLSRLADNGLIPKEELAALGRNYTMGDAMKMLDGHKEAKEQFLTERKYRDLHKEATQEVNDLVKNDPKSLDKPATRSQMKTLESAKEQGVLSDAELKLMGKDGLTVKEASFILDQHPEIAGKLNLSKGLDIDKAAAEVDKSQPAESQAQDERVIAEPEPSGAGYDMNDMTKNDARAVQAHDGGDADHHTLAKEPLSQTEVSAGQAQEAPSPVPVQAEPAPAKEAPAPQPTDSWKGHIDKSIENSFRKGMSITDFAIKLERSGIGIQTARDGSLQYYLLDDPYKKLNSINTSSKVSFGSFRESGIGNRTDGKAFEKVDNDIYAANKAVEAVRGVTNPVAAVAHDVVGRGLPDAPTDPIR